MYRKEIMRAIWLSRKSSDKFSKITENNSNKNLQVFGARRPRFNVPVNGKHCLAVEPYRHGGGGDVVKKKKKRRENKR